MQQMCHRVIVEHKLNDNFSHCNYCMNFPCDAVLIACVLSYTTLQAYKSKVKSEAPVSYLIEAFN